jgi:hypothetical protein
MSRRSLPSAVLSQKRLALRLFPTGGIHAAKASLVHDGMFGFAGCGGGSAAPNGTSSRRLINPDAVIPRTSPGGCRSWLIDNIPLTGNYLPGSAWGLPFAKGGTFVVTFRERNSRIKFTAAPLPMTINPFRNVSAALRSPGARYRLEIPAAAKLPSTTE